MMERKFKSVSNDAPPDYPISVHERLDSHFFIQWNLKRWRKSRFRQLADPEVGWYGFQLFCEAHDESPVGTLPVEPKLLAAALGITVEHWLRLSDRDISPLHNWAQVTCDNGEVRYAHPVVTEVATEALKSKRKNAEERDARARAKRIKDLGAMVEKLGASQLLSNPKFLDAFDDWLVATYPERRRLQNFVRTSLDEFMEDQAP